MGEGISPSSTMRCRVRLTSGSGTYSMKFASYEQVPADVQEKLLKAYTDTDEE